MSTRLPAMAAALLLSCGDLSSDSVPQLSQEEPATEEQRQLLAQEAWGCLDEGLLDQNDLRTDEVYTRLLRVRTEGGAPVEGLSLEFCERGEQLEACPLGPQSPATFGTVWDDTSPSILQFEYRSSLSTQPILRLRAPDFIPVDVYLEYRVAPRAPDEFGDLKIPRGLFVEFLSPETFRSFYDSFYGLDTRGQLGTGAIDATLFDCTGQPALGAELHVSTENRANSPDLVGFARNPYPVGGGDLAVSQQTGRVGYSNVVPGLIDVTARTPNGTVFYTNTVRVRELQTTQFEASPLVAYEE